VIFQVQLAEALSRADKSIIAGVPDPEKVDEDDRLDPRQLASDIQKLLDALASS